jgi:hypothetical protein
VVSHPFHKEREMDGARSIHPSPVKCYKHKKGRSLYSRALQNRLLPAEELFSNLHVAFWVSRKVAFS